MRKVPLGWRVALKFIMIFATGGIILGIIAIEALRALGAHIFIGEPFIIGFMFTSALILLFGERVVNWLLPNIEDVKCQEMVKHQSKQLSKKWRT